MASSDSYRDVLDGSYSIRLSKRNTLILANVGFASWIAWSLGQACLPNGILPFDFAMMFSNGIMVALCATMIRIADPRWGQLPFLGAYFGLGCLHPFWMLPLTEMARLAARAVAPTLPVPSNNAMMFTVTGVVLGTVVAFDVRKWWALAIMVAATSLATWLADQQLNGVPLHGRFHTIGLPASALHIGLATSLWLAWLCRFRHSLPATHPTP